MTISFEGEEWESAEAIQIRDHNGCYTTPLIPIPTGGLETEQWLRDGMMRVLQEVVTAKERGFEADDWSDSVCHLAVAYRGVTSMIAAILNYLPPLDALKLRGEMFMLQQGSPATMLNRECNRQHPERGEQGPHESHSLILGLDVDQVVAGGNPDRGNYFPAEWMMDGTPDDGTPDE